MPSLSSPLLNNNLAANVNVTTNNYDPSSYASAVESSATATAIGRGRGRSGGGTAGTASASATTMMQDNEICSGTTDINLMSRKRTTYDINDTGILLLPGTTSNMILIERFLFWQIIWNKLHALGWILETQAGNQLRDDFYFFPPHAIKTTTISDDGRNGSSSRRSLSSNLKPNIDFFDDELRIMHCLITDSRYTLLEPKISMICNEYKEYLFQLKVLQSLKSSEDDASRIHINHMFPHSIYTPNKQMMDYIQNRVQIRLSSLSNATNGGGGRSPSSITRGTPSSSALSYSKMMIMTMKRRAIEEEAINSMNANANANANNNNVHNNNANNNRPQQNHQQMLSHHHPRHHNYNNINNAVLQNHHYHLLQQQQQLHQQQQHHNEQQQRLLLQEIARRNRITTTTTPTAKATASDNRDMTAAAMGTTHIASSITALTRNDRDAKVYAKAKAKSDNGGNDKASRTARITNDDIRKLDVLCDDASFISKKPPIIENTESAAIDNDNNNSHNNKSDDEKNLLLSKNCGNIIYLELMGDSIEEYCTYEQDAKERTEICLELVRNVTSNCGRFLARKEVGYSGSGNNSGENGTTTNKNNKVVEDDEDDETNNNNTNNNDDDESFWYELEEEQAVFITKLDLEELEITKDVTSKKTPTTASSPALSSTNENNINTGNRTTAAAPPPPPPPPEAASTATNADAGYGKLKRRISSVSSMSSTPSSYSTTSKTKRTSSCGSPTLSSSSDYATAVARISSSCGNSGSESVRAKYIRQKAVKDVKMEERRRKPLLKRNLMTKCSKFLKLRLSNIHATAITTNSPSVRSRSLFTSTRNVHT